jgi:hypothetical protein
MYGNNSYDDGRMDAAFVHARDDKGIDTANSYPYGAVVE